MEFKNFAFLAATCLFFFSCGISKKAQMERLYLQGIDTSLYSDVLFPEPLVQKGDLLTIMVYSDNEEATRIYNQQQGAANNMNTNVNNNNLSNLGASGRGYQVDGDGGIYFHSIGNIYVAGKTRQQIADTIKSHLRDQLQNVYITVRFTSKKVTVLGEVNNPGVLNLPDQKVSILDVLGLSGDLTNYGRRDNILIIREEDGERKSSRLDIRNPDIYKSPYFYMKQNDFVYIEPNRRKSAGNEQLFVRNVSIITSLLSVITVGVTLLTR